MTEMMKAPDIRSVGDRRRLQSGQHTHREHDGSPTQHRSAITVQEKKPWDVTGIGLPWLPYFNNDFSPDQGETGTMTVVLVLFLLLALMAMTNAATATPATARPAAHNHIPDPSSQQQPY